MRIPLCFKSGITCVNKVVFPVPLCATKPNIGILLFNISTKGLDCYHKTSYFKVLFIQRLCLHGCRQGAGAEALSIREYTVIRILLILLAIMAFFGIRAFLKTPPAILARYIKLFFLSIAGLAALYLLTTGRLNWFFTLIGIVFAYLLRLIPVLPYVAHLHNLWSKINATKQNGSQQSTSNNSKMSVEEALEVLGLKMGATKSEIIAAHRKLIQKIHPDRGGSDYLAKKINLAKKTLLKE